jgi:molybdopterin-binding protein
MPDLLTAQEAAQLLHLHVKRVQALARAGKLPAVRHGRRWLFSRDRLTRPADAISHGAEPTVHGAEISARNQLRCGVSSIIVDGIMAEVRLEVGDQELVAVITRSSAERLGLQPGVEALAIIKATEVMIGRATPDA